MSKFVAYAESSEAIMNRIGQASITGLGSKRSEIIGSDDNCMKLVMIRKFVTAGYVTA
ncbi:MAG: hypothetical protein HRT36_04300 [Alphaproteobacteria bacterium]|nr:hypothetical protein [Alphaproteobacteria bacterium]